MKQKSGDYVQSSVTWLRRERRTVGGEARCTEHHWLFKRKLYTKTSFTLKVFLKCFPSDRHVPLDPHQLCDCHPALLRFLFMSCLCSVFALCPCSRQRSVRITHWQCRWMWIKSLSTTVRRLCSFNAVVFFGGMGSTWNVWCRSRKSVALMFICQHVLLLFPEDNT